MSKSVEFLFDYGSPTSYLAYHMIKGASDRTGANVEYVPILLGGIFKSSGGVSPMEIPAKRTWMEKDLQRVADLQGIPFKMNPNFPMNTLPVMRGAVVAQLDGQFLKYSDAIFAAFWKDGEKMDDPGTIVRVLETAGLDARHYFSRTQDDDVKEALKSTTGKALERGVFGAPTFFVNGVMHFGQDRLDFVERDLANG